MFKILSTTSGVSFFHCGDSSLWSRVDDFIVREENIS